MLVRSICAEESPSGRLFTLSGDVIEMEEGTERASSDCKCADFGTFLDFSECENCDSIVRSSRLQNESSLVALGLHW